MGQTKNPPTGSVAPAELLSVGKVAKETGISPDTLRIWERRYGCPVPYRLPSGHRRYSAGQAQWLRLVSEALARGLRPSKVLPLEPNELEEMLQADTPVEPDARTLEYVRLLRALDSDELTRRLLARAAMEQPVEFLEHCIGQLLTHVGAAWATGRLEVRHERLCSEVVASVLQRVRVGASELRPRALGLNLVLATLPDDRHDLGLLMVACLAELKGVSVKLLGSDIPSTEILAAARECKARAVGISVSVPRGGIQADQLLAQLAEDLGPDVELIAGGGGSRSGRRSPRGVRILVSLGELDRWLAGWIARSLVQRQ